MVRFVRVNKHPDHGEYTWFRLFIDEELVTNFAIHDEYADRFENGTTPASPDAPDKALTALYFAAKKTSLFIWQLYRDSGSDSHDPARDILSELDPALKAIDKSRLAG